MDSTTIYFTKQQSVNAGRIITFKRNQFFGKRDERDRLYVLTFVATFAFNIEFYHSRFVSTNPKLTQTVVMS